MKKSRKFHTQDSAVMAAALRSDINGAPVAVVLYRGSYWMVERAETYERLCDKGAEAVAVMDPEN